MRPGATPSIRMSARCLRISCVSRHDRSVRSARLVGQASLGSRPYRRLRARVSRAVDHRELPCRPGRRAVPRLPGCHDRPRQTPRPPAPDGQAAAPSANTSRNGRERGPVLCYSRWVNITELVIFHRSGGSSPPSDTFSNLFRKGGFRGFMHAAGLRVIILRCSYRYRYRVLIGQGRRRSPLTPAH
jgi:hypothetical protein